MVPRSRLQTEDSEVSEGHGRIQLKCDGTRWRSGEEVKVETGEWSG